MTRVLLFVQTGDARPKCVKSFGWIAHDGGASPRALQYLGRIQFGTHLQPDRGWLVECANAEDGRFVIECDREAGGVLRDHYASDGERIYGRILASGGKR